MRIELRLPHKTLLDRDVDKITAPGTEGSFQILPRHVDVVWSLQSGILGMCFGEDEVFYAIDRGILVKNGETVHVSCYEAIRGDSLEALNRMISERFSEVYDREKKTRQVLLSMEMNTKLRLKQLEQ